MKMKQHALDLFEARALETLSRYNLDQVPKYLSMLYYSPEYPTEWDSYGEAVDGDLAEYECAQSPKGTHEWVWSGVPKGMSWCKHCDKDELIDQPIGR